MKNRDVVGIALRLLGITLGIKAILYMLSSSYMLIDMLDESDSTFMWLTIIPYTLLYGIFTYVLLAKADTVMARIFKPDFLEKDTQIGKPGVGWYALTFIVLGVMEVVWSSMRIIQEIAGYFSLPEGLEQNIERLSYSVLTSTGMLLIGVYLIWRGPQLGERLHTFQTNRAVTGDDESQAVM